MIKVSVVIPVYNTECYLRQCLDSALEQTLTDLEIICVDDGSTDNSPHILEEYAKRDNRIKIIHKKNAGLVAARKTGVAAASGVYVGYVDSDDWIEPDMFEKLYQAAATNQVDLVSSGFFMEGNYTTLHFDSMACDVYAGEKMREIWENAIYCLERKETGIRASLCCKLFKRELLEKIQFSVSNKLTISEDKMCLLSYLLECSSVMILKEAFYHYRLHTASMVHSVKTDYLLSVNEVYQHLLSLYEHPCFTENMRVQAELYVIELLVKGINSRLGFRHRNLLWVDPYWLEYIPVDSRIVLYGAGELGEKYWQQILAAHKQRRGPHYVACIDPGYEKYTGGSFIVQSPDTLRDMEYDYIVITIKNYQKAAQIKKQLVQTGIGEDKVLWFEQPEIFWKYAQADGLL